MTWIALLRHGITNWNERGLIQGRNDIALCERGEKILRRAQPCEAYLSAHWASSPLQRARQTAEILNPHTRPQVTRALIETDWGEFSGMRRDELETRIAERNITPPRGLDFQPPGGESPRMVRERLLQWMRARADASIPTVAVTHKGVIRSALSAACDWDMQKEFHERADWSLPHVFYFRDGALQLAQLNCAWETPPEDFLPRD